MVWMLSLYHGNRSVTKGTAFHRFFRDDWYHVFTEGWKVEAIIHFRGFPIAVSAIAARGCGQENQRPRKPISQVNAGRLVPSSCMRPVLDLHVLPTMYPQ